MTITTPYGPYNPSYGRSSLGAFNTQKAYSSVKVGSEAYFIEDEMNEMQTIINQERSHALSLLCSSGSLNKGADSIAAGVLTMTARDLLINGELLRMEGKASDGAAVKVTLPAAPGSGTRQDLVYISVMHVEVNGSTPSTIYKYGYTGGDTLTNDLLDSRYTGAETSRRIQRQWSMKTAAGVVDVSTQGYTQTTYDPNLYSKANASSVDGVEYVIPLYIANRVFGGTDYLTDISPLIGDYARSGSIPGPTAMALANGQQIVNTSRSGLMQNLNARGRSLVNLTGRLGGLKITGKNAVVNVTESVDTTNYVYGTQAMKYTASGSTSVEHYAPIGGGGPNSITVKANTNYLLVGHMRPNVGQAKLRAILYNSSASLLTDVSSSVITDTTQFSAAYVKIPANASGALIEPRAQVLNASGATAYVPSGTAENATFDGFRLYEIDSSADWSAIDTMTISQITAKYPYIDDMKHLSGLYVTRYGENLLPDFSQWTQNVDSNGSWAITGPYAATLTTLSGASNDAESMYVLVPVMPNQQYTLTVPASTNGGFAVTDSINSTLIVPWTTAVSTTFNTGSNTTIRVYIGNNTAGAGTYTFTNPRLNIGGNATTIFSDPLTSNAAWTTQSGSFTNYAASRAQLGQNTDFEKFTSVATVFSDPLTSGAAWTTQSGSFTYSGSGATSGAAGAALTAGNSAWKPLTGSGGQNLALTAQVTFAEPATVGTGKLQFFTDSNNYYMTYVSSTTFYLIKYVAGAWTTLVQVAQTISANTTYTMTLSRDTAGVTTAKLYAGSGTGGTLLQTLTATDTSLTGGFLVGVGGDTGVVISNAKVTAPFADGWVPGGEQRVAWALTATSPISGSYSVSAVGFTGNAGGWLSGNSGAASASTAYTISGYMSGTGVGTAEVYANISGGSAQTLLASATGTFATTRATGTNTTPTGTTTFALVVQLNGAGTAVFDAIQLEASSSATAYMRNDSTSGSLTVPAGAYSSTLSSFLTAGSSAYKPLASSGNQNPSSTIQATFTTQTTLTGNGGLIELFQSSGNYYYANIDGSNGKFWLVKYVGGVATNLASVNQTITVSTTYTITLTRDSTGLLTAVLYSGSGTGTPLQILTVTDTALTGPFLLGVGGDTGVTIANASAVLTSGDKGFKPRNDDMMIFPLPIASSVDGTVYDQIFQRDGRYWRENRFVKDMVLDGSLAWVFSTSQTGFKRVAVPISNCANNPLTNAVKYDGKILTNGSTTTAADYFGYDNAGNMYFSIASSDSGWGDSYTPTAAEVQAYFYGWVMFNGTAGPSPTNPANNVYNGTGTKWWAARGANGTWIDGTSTLPTGYAPGAVFTPYKLTYQLATSTFEDITTQIEGEINLLEGANQIEVGAGMQWREKAAPVDNTSGAYTINNWNPSAATKRRVGKFIAIYKNGKVDPNWAYNSFGTSPNATYGQYLAYESYANYDATATYEVTYQALDQYLLTSSAVTTMTAEYDANVKTIQDRNSQRVADLAQRLSVAEMLAARTYQKPSMSLQNTTYYVDGTNGSDSGDGSAAKPFKTIGKAVSMIPPILAHNYTIQVAFGTYNETVTVYGLLAAIGAATLSIKGDTVLSSNVNVNNFILSRCQVPITVTGFNATSTTNHSFDAIYCSSVIFNYCNTTVTSGSYGFHAWGASIDLESCQVSNKYGYVDADWNSRVIINNASGTGNTWRHTCFNGGIIHKQGTDSVTSTNGDQANNGGSIWANGVINPWGDNTQTARSAVIAYQSSGITLTTAFTDYAIPYQSKNRDQLGEWNTDTFTPQHDGWYAFKASCGFTGATAGMYAQLNLYVNGSVIEQIGTIYGVPAGTVQINGAVITYLTAGQAAKIYVNSSQSGITTDVNSIKTRIEITRIA